MYILAPLNVTLTNISHRTGRRRKSNSFLLSQRSNGLLFSHHHFLSPQPSSPRGPHRILSQIDGNAPTRPRDRVSITLLPVDEHPHPKPTPVRSLIPPVIPSRLKSSTRPIRRRRNSSSSTSLKSITSSILSRHRRMVPTPSLATIPAELLALIFASLPQRDLHALMLTNSNFIEVAAIYLYLSPKFSSTYRFAQFVYQASHKPHYASMLRILDLSYFSKLSTDTETGEMLPLAGWREFKYRHREVYCAKQRHAHPAPSLLLKSYHRTRDVPIGALLHVFAACRRLREINLSRVQLAADFMVESGLFRATGLVFVSDVAGSWTWTSRGLMAVGADEVVRWVCGLGELRVLRARGCVWLTTFRVGRLMEGAGRGLLKVDFRESGMQKDVRWAVKKSRGEVEKIVKEVLENTRDGAS